MNDTTIYRVKGFLAPYDQENNWGETFACRALQGKLAPVPAKIMHVSNPIGYWTNVWEDMKGIWAEGFLIEPRVTEHMREFKKDFPELSISWVGVAGDYKTSREWREQNKIEHVMVNADAVRGLAEVSFVDSGAFRGTSWEALEVPPNDHLAVIRQLVEASGATGLM